MLDGSYEGYESVEHEKQDALHVGNFVASQKKFKLSLLYVTLC